MRALLWFRSDLRVHDNTALAQACKAADKGVVAVFALCHVQWREHDWGPMKIAFVLRNLGELSTQLGKLHIPLLVVRRDHFEDLPQALLVLAKKHKCDGLFFNREYEVNELQRDQAATELFEENDRRVHAFDDQLVLDVSQIRSSTGGYYTVFTPFKRKWCEWLKAEGPARPLSKPRAQLKLNIAPHKTPKSISAFTGHDRPDLWPGGERVAQKRLRQFVSKRIEAYDRQRDFPDVNGTSTLSPYLAAGVLSPRQCLAAAMEANQGRVDSGKKGIVTWISELIWREFYRHVLIGFPRVCQNRPFKLETEALKWNTDEVLFEAWCEGQTGVPIVDAAMRQLNDTGWMHNRLRMIVAMFLSKNLFLDWTWGERYFMSKLVDGDFASNNGGWQWSASTGTDAAPYFRIFNPFSQAKKFDPEADFIRRFAPELEKFDSKLIHDEKRRAALGDYPEPVVDVKQTRQRAIDAFKKLS